MKFTFCIIHCFWPKIFYSFKRFLCCRLALKSLLSCIKLFPGFYQHQCDQNQLFLKISHFGAYLAQLLFMLFRSRIFYFLTVFFCSSLPIQSLVSCIKLFSELFHLKYSQKLTFSKIGQFVVLLPQFNLWFFVHTFNYRFLTDSYNFITKIREVMSCREVNKTLDRRVRTCMGRQIEGCWNMHGITQDSLTIRYIKESFKKIYNNIEK